MPLPWECIWSIENLSISKPFDWPFLYPVGHYTLPTCLYENLKLWTRRQCCPRMRCSANPARNMKSRYLLSCNPVSLFRQWSVAYLCSFGREHQTAMAEHVWGAPCVDRSYVQGSTTQRGPPTPAHQREHLLLQPCQVTSRSNSRCERIGRSQVTNE